MATPFDPTLSGVPAEDILGAADRIRIPHDLFSRREAETAANHASLEKLASGEDKDLPTIAVKRDSSGKIVSYISGSSQSQLPGNFETLSPEETRDFLLPGPHEATIGDWPAEPPESLELTVATDVLTGKPLEKVHIALIPTDDWTTVPAHLHWGGWNDCPAPEYHVAVFRSWRDRYGIELAGMGFDTLNLCSSRRPDNRAAALALAREHYAYCTDIVDQGTQTLSVLAAALMTDDWWYFWWD